MDQSRQSNVRKGGDRKNQNISRVETNDENKQPSQNAAKNGVRPADKRDSKKSSETSSTVTLPKGNKSTATPEQMRMAALAQVGASDSVLSDMIKKVCELTGCTQDDAVTALHDTGNDPEAAINLVLEGGTNKDEWETTGRKGKKKPKAKPEPEVVSDGGLENPVFGGYIRGSQSSSSNRGRGAQRNTSNRGGRGGPPPSVPRGSHPDDSANVDGGSQRTFPPGERPSSPKATRGTREEDSRLRGMSENAKPEPQERLWNEDADDDWKENIRETKVFTRSAPVASSSVSAPQPIQNRVQQPATAGSSSPSFSAMVQKQSQQPSWTNSGVPSGSNAPTATQRQSAADVSNWKQQPPAAAAPATLTSKTPASGGTSAEHPLPAVGPVPVQPHAALVTPHKELPSDVAQQLGLQFGSMSFNRTSYDSRPEPPNQTAIPSQSQTFSSRNAVGGHVPREAISSDQTAPHRSTVYPLSPGDPSRFQNVTSLSGSNSYGVPAQTASFGSLDQDTSANTYSAKNLQSSTVFNSSQQTNLPARSPSGTFSDQRLTSGHPASSVLSPGAGVTSMQDSRFSQQSTAPSAATLSKSPQNPQQSARTDLSGFGQTQPKPPQTQSQSPSAQPEPQQQHYGQQSTHQTLPHGMRQTPGYSSYGGMTGDSGARNTYTAFSASQMQSGVMNAGAQKDGSIALQQQQQQAVQPTASSSSIATGISSRNSTSTSVFNTGSKPSPVPVSSSLGFKTYPTQPNPAATQSLLGQQQQYLTQGQAQYGQQNPLPMFPGMYGGALDGLTDPRLQSVMQPNMSLEYSSYQTPLPSRDATTLGYSSADPNKYRSDPMSGVQTQVSQQQGLQHLSGPYASYMYTPTGVPQPSYGYAPSAVYPPTLSSGYGKAGGSLGSSYPSSYHDMSTLSDASKVASAYGSPGLRGFSSDAYGNPGILSGSSDINSGYYGNKPGNKQFDNKPSQSFGMHMPGGQQTTAAYSQQQYYPTMMQQQPQQLHQMGQVPQNSGQNLGNNKPKGPSIQSYGQNQWGGHQ